MDSHENEVRRVEQQRQALIDAIKRHEPENLDELLAANHDNEAEHELEWVDVPDPRPSAATGGSTINVLPVLRLSDGNKDAEYEKDINDKGIFGLQIMGRLASGQEDLIGELIFFHKDGALQYEPMLSIAGLPVASDSIWQSADAELFVRLAQSAIDSQP